MNNNDSKETKNAPNTEKKQIRAGGVALFGNLRVMAAAAMLAALSIILGKYLAINIGDSIRLSFENLPVLMAGLFFGPVVGATVGAVADIVGCLMVGYGIIPIITLGAALMGAISGAIGMYAFPKTPAWKGTWRIFVPVALSHIVGSMCIKSIGMVLYYGTPWEIIFLRIPIYTVIIILEGYLLKLLFRNKTFTGEINRIINKKKKVQK